MLSYCFFVEYMIKQAFFRIIFRCFFRSVNVFFPSSYYLCFILIIPRWLSGDTVYAQELTWPIDSPKRISSSFGEPRPGRFHFGVDFKSGGVTGKKIVAIGNGYISRVHTSPFGYGKGLYLVTSLKNRTQTHIEYNKNMMENLLYFAVKWLKSKRR